MTSRVVATRYGRHALETLRDVVRDAKATDPMAPVTVLLPNNIAGVVARRHLATRGLTDDGPNAIAGLFLATLPRLAEQIAAASIAPARPATGPIVAAAWRAALDTDAGVFESVKDHPATIRALVAAHRELRDLSDHALGTVGAASPLTTATVDLHRAVTDRLRANWYDTTDLLHRAAELVDADATTTDDAGHLVLYLPQELTQAEARFAKSLAARGDLTVIAGLTGVSRADRVVHRSLRRIGLGTDERRKPITAHEAMHASDSDDEVRCVVRDVVGTLRETPAHRIAILYARTHPYARLLNEHLTAAGITVNGAGGRPVDERAIGRAFLGVLALAVDDLPRADFFRTISEAPTRAADGSRVPTSRWERISRAAAIVSGGDWATRLDAYASSVERSLADERVRDDPLPGRIAAHERDIDAASDLRAFATRLRERLHTGQSLTTWAELSDWARQLFTDLYGDTAQLAQLPPEEQHAAVTVEATLRGLGTLDLLEPTADLTRLTDVLASELAAALPRVGRFGDGVLVAPISAAIGLDADAVYVVGLAEDTYPGRIHEDALLLERVRKLADGELASHRDRLDARHRHLLAAFDAAPRVVASFPRGDLRRSTGRLPSRWLLPTLRKLCGDLDLAATEWESAVSDRIRRSDSFARSLTTTAMPASEQEWRTRAAHDRRLDSDPIVASADALLRARASDAFTRFDGNLTGVYGLPDPADGVRRASPTALEAYAECPHGYFVQRLLRIEPIEHPEEVLKISALDIGSLIHETMDAFITEQADALPGFGEPWSPAQRARLREIAVETAIRYERRGATGHQRLWQAERDRILADLDWMLDSDDQWRATRDARVVSSELAFGFDGDPVGIDIGGRTVMLRGSADKVDEARDGTIIVTDIKTGGSTSYKVLNTDPVAAGTKLQLPAYAHAARQLLHGEAVEAAYWFVRRGKRDRIPVPLTDEVEVRYARTVGVLARSIAAGLYPAKPPEVPDFAWVQCPYCNPDGIGHGDARGRYERKRHDPALRELVELVDPAASAERDGITGESDAESQKRHAQRGGEEAR
ncbi:MAG: PD-(D/E)XK nuclease family protein [Nocardioidaceae bacterium]